MQNFSEVQLCVSHAQNILAKSGCTLRPETGIVLGTGLGELSSALTDVFCLPYTELPHFPRSTVPSHVGQFVFGRLNGVEVLLQQGRCHLYEGYDPAAVCMGVRVMHGLGVRKLIITNAAGALNPQWDAGDLMCITDHINLTGQSPLRGVNHEAWGERFPDMSAAYDAAFVRCALACARDAGVRLERGVYAGVTGPNMDTPAETRYLRTIGADAVGMSTVLEVIAARHMGMRVLGISCLTNKNLPDCMSPAPLADVLRVAGHAGAGLTSLVSRIVTKL